MNKKLENEWGVIQANPYYRLSDEHGDMFLNVLCESPNWYEIVPNFCRSHVLSYLARLERKTPEVADDYRKINVYMYTLLRKVMDANLQLSPDGETVDEKAIVAVCMAVASKMGVRTFGSALPFLTGTPSRLTRVNNEHTAAFISTLLGGNNVYMWLAAYLTWLQRERVVFNPHMEQFRESVLSCTEIVGLPYILSKGMGVSMRAHDTLNLSAFWYHKQSSAGPNTQLSTTQKSLFGILMGASIEESKHRVYELNGFKDFKIVEDVYAKHATGSCPEVKHKIVDGNTGNEYSMEILLGDEAGCDDTYNLLDFINKLGSVVDNPLFSYKMKYHTA